MLYKFMEKNEETIKSGGNKILLCVFILSLSVLGFQNKLFASPAPKNAKVQQITDKRVTLRMLNTTLVNILSEIKKQTGLAYGFRDNRNATRNELYSISVSDVTVEVAMTSLLRNSPFTYKIEGGLILIISRQEQAQEEARKKAVKITGRVVDEKGNPLPGASVIIHNTTVGVISDANGRYTIEADPNEVLQVTFVGYKPEVIPLKGKTELDIQMEPTAENLEEAVVVAFGQQKKESVVSAITTVRPMDLKTSSSDLTSSFAGKIAGIVGWQTSGLPAALTEDEMNTKFYIRGITSFQTGANVDPLILLDGVESSKLDLSRIAPEDIETFSVMKDASATAMYGARGANGVILVTTKKGTEGSVYATARYEAIFSMPTREIDVVDPITYMHMYNRALMARNSLADPKYTVERINRTASGKYPSWVYPKNDWYDMMFKNFNVNHHAGVNIRGGSKVMQYYASVNYNRDQGMLKTDKLNDFDVNITNSQTSYRTNLTINLKAGIQLLINSSASFDKYHGPLIDAQNAYGLAFSASPVDFAPLYPADETYSWPHLRFGTTSAQVTNPYMALQQGYTERTRYSTINRAEYIHNLSPLIKGLEARASVSVSQSGYTAEVYSTVPFLYSLDEGNYDFETGKHILSAVNPKQARRTLEKEGSSVQSSSTRVTYEARLLHTAAWKNHQTSLTAAFQAMEATSNPIETVLQGIPQRNLTFSMRGTYGFKDRYFIEGSFGYNGSERFAKKNKMGFFPAGGLAYVLSSEPFMASTAHWMPFLKLRLSYGKVGNDGVIKDPRFVYLPEVSDQGPAVDQTPFGGQFKRYFIAAYGNPNIQWEIAEQTNLGLEMKFFKGILELNLDLYEEIRHNILGNRITIPANMGIEMAPLDNIGKARSRGIDFSGKVQHAFSPDFWVILNGTLTYNKAVYKEVEEATNKPAWQRKVGKELSQNIGYIAEGLFRDRAEIENSPTQPGEAGLMPGDIRYRDLNNDGVIDVNDATHIGFPETPRITYGFSGNINYKNFEFAFSFQGSGKRSFFISPKEISPFFENRTMLSAIYNDHWSEDNMTDRPFWPRLSTQSITEINPLENWNNRNNYEERKSTYFMRECRFLRCTSMELIYSMPKKAMQRMRLQNMKFFVRANNPFLITNFKLWDVELGGSGFNYPIQKTYTVGMNFSF